jgi:hypothetical protein
VSSSLCPSVGAEVQGPGPLPEPVTSRCSGLDQSELAADFLECAQGLVEIVTGVNG